MRLAHAAIAISCLTGVLHAEGFQGWQSLKVIRQEGEPRRLRVADLDGKGGREILVVNTRQARLEVYQWLPQAQRKAAPAADPDRVNDLPTAPELERTEIPLNELPLDVLPVDLDKDGRLELVVLVSNPNRVLLLKADAQGKYTQTDRWDLLPAEMDARDQVMLGRPRRDGSLDLLISTDKGIQVLTLQKGNRPRWLSPREEQPRADWWLADVDGDGDLDLLEWSRKPGETVRWYEADASEALLPPLVLFDRPTDQVQVLLTSKGPAELLLLGGLQRDQLRRYQLTKGAAGEIGRRQGLPLPERAPWTSALLDNAPALIAADPSHPQLLVHVLGDSGWQAAQTFPIQGRIENLATPLGRPGSIFLLAKDAGDLLESHWDKHRLTYPAPLVQSQVEDRRVIALDSVGKLTWWVQRVGKDLDLYLLRPGQAEPEKLHFPDAGDKADKAVYLGGSRLLVLPQYARNPKLVELVEGKSVITEPAQVKRLAIEEVRVYEVEGTIRPARLAEGVLQWLGPDLNPTDQVMLPEGAKLAAFVPLAEGGAWGLEQGGEQVHRLKADSSGVYRVTDSFRLPGGVDLLQDPVLGLMLMHKGRVTRLSAGESVELKLLESLDARVGRPEGIRDAAISRVFSADVTGDGQAEVLLSDDPRHQLTLLQRVGGSLLPLMSWPVFENRAYPYGDSGGRMRGGNAEAGEPRAMAALDLDGDQRQDLVMLCHDRLLIYIAKENP